MKARVQFIVFAIIFLLSRVIWWNRFPLFEDEALYIYFASFIEKNWAEYWAISYNMGIGPVFSWITALLIPITGNVLFAGRMTSAIFSLAGFYGIGVVAQALFDRTVAFLSRIFYLFVPFLLLYDRLAMLDSLALSFILLTLSGFTKFAEGKTYSWLMIIVGLIFGTLTKPTGFIAFILGPILALTIRCKRKISHKELFFFISSMVLMEVAALVWIVTAIFHSLDVFIPTYNRIVETKSSVPLWFIRENAHKAKIWIVQYSSPTLITLAILGFFAVIIKKKRAILFLGLWVGITLILPLFISKHWYPRYILPSIPLLILLASYTISEAWKTLRQVKIGRWIGVCLFSFMLLPMAYNDYLLVTMPEKAQMPAEDRTLYFNLWTSGVFAEQAKFFFRERLKHENSVVVFTDTMKVLPIGLTLPLSRENSNFKGEMLRQLTFPTGSLPRQVLEAAKKNEKVYLVFTRYPNPPDEWNLQLEAKYPALSIYSYSYEAN